MKKVLQGFHHRPIRRNRIEYGLIAAGISLAIISIVNGLGAKLNTRFASINTSLR